MEPLAAIIVAFIFGTVAVPTAVVTGNSQVFCEKVLGGTYTPAPPPADVCPGGDWGRVVGAIKEKQSGSGTTE